MSKLAFRAISEYDLAFLDEIRGKKLHKMHLKRINKQKKGFAEYVIAFDKGKPVGHVFIDHLRSKRRYPLSEDLYVKESERNKGFGKQIIGYAEQEARKRGFSQVGLDLETKEFWLQSFYVGLGYVRASGVRKSTFVMPDSKRKVTQVFFHLKKRV